MNDMYKSMCGYRLVESPFVTKHVQVRKHRKMRINKKWLKRYGFKCVPDYETVIVACGCIVAQPKTIQRLISTTKEQNNAKD